MLLGVCGCALATGDVVLFSNVLLDKKLLIHELGASEVTTSAVSSFARLPSAFGWESGVLFISLSVVGGSLAMSSAASSELSLGAEFLRSISVFMSCW